MNAVVYCRVSTKEQVKNLSLGTQQDKCIELCTRNGWPVHQVFRDEGESAKTADRPQFQRMLTHCKNKQNEISYVVVHDLSRFSRSLDDQVAVISELASAGVLLRSVSENVDETAAGKFMSNIYGAFNQFDNDRKAERTKLGMQRAASVGRFPFKAPLGYLNVPGKNVTNLIPDPERAPLIEKAFELYSTGAETKANVLRTLNALGLKTHRGTKITPQTFGRLLQNPIYAGWIEIPQWKVRERGSFRSLVSDELFNRVQEILSGKRVSVTTHQRSHPDFSLRVFVRCGSCDTPLTGSWSKGRNYRYAYYRCRKPDCRAVNIRREKLEKQFVELLGELTPERHYMRLFSEIVRHVWTQKQASSQELIRKAAGNLEQLRQRKNRMVDAFLDGRLDKQTYDEQVVRLKG